MPMWHHHVVSSSHSFPGIQNTEDRQFSALTVTVSRATGVPIWQYNGKTGFPMMSITTACTGMHASRISTLDTNVLLKYIFRDRDRDHDRDRDRDAIEGIRAGR